MPEEKSKELRFVQIIDPQLFHAIPRPLLRQIDGLTDHQIDVLLAYGKCAIRKEITEDGRLELRPNPLIYIALLIDPENKIHGMIWASFNIVEELIFVELAVVDRAHQGDFRKRIVEHLFGLKVEMELLQACKKKIRMATARPRAYKRSGWKQTPRTLMEIDYDDMVEANTSEGGEA